MKDPAAVRLGRKMEKLMTNQPNWQGQDDSCGCGRPDCTGDPRDHNTGSLESANDTVPLAIADSDSPPEICPDCGFSVVGCHCGQI